MFRFHGRVKNSVGLAVRAAFFNGRGGQYNSPNTTGGFFESAYFYAVRTSTITQTRGAGTPTETRATVATVTNNDGYLVTALSGELREEGARRVRNLLTQTTDASGANWTKGTVAVSGETITASAGAGNHWVYQAFTSTTGNTYIAQVKAKAGTAGFVALGWGNAATTEGVFFNLTTGVKGTTNGTVTGEITGPDANGYYLCSIKKTTPTGNVSVEIHTADNQAITWAAAGNETVNAKELQLEDVTAQTTQTAGEYVSVGVPSDWAGTELVTNGTFDSGTTGWAAAVGATLSIDTNRLKITNDGTGANAGEAQQAITTVAGAKYVLYATGTAGTISPSIKVGTTAGAQDLLTNSGCTGFNSFTFTATGTTSYVSLRANAVTASGTVFFDDVGVKPAHYHGAGVDGVKYFSTDISGAPIPAATLDGSVVEAAATQYLGVTGTPATQTTASLGTGTYTLWVDAPGSGSCNLSAGTATISAPGAAENNTPYTFTVTGAGTVTATVVGVLTRFNLTNTPYETSYIENTGAVGTSATRNKDVLDDQVASNLTGPAGTVAFTWTPSHDPSGTIALCGGYEDANNSTQILHDGTKYIFRKKVLSDYDAELTAAFVSGTPVKVAIRWGANGTQIAVDGVLGTANANAVAARLGTRWQWGADGNGGQQAGAAFKEMYLTPRTMSDAELQAITV